MALRIISIPTHYTSIADILPLNTLAPQLLTSLETRQLPKAKAIE
jgi:hypothetical protein